jgi:hypothetical protein
VLIDWVDHYQNYRVRRRFIQNGYKHIRIKDLRRCRDRYKIYRR